MVASRRKLLSDIVYSYLPFLASKSRGVVLVYLLTKTFSESGYGLWTQYAVTVILISRLGNLGLHHAMNRFIPGVSEEVATSRFYSVAVVSTCVGALIAVGLIAVRAPLSVQFFGGSQNADVILYLAVGVVANLYFRVVVQFLRARRRIREMNLWRTGRILLEMAVIGVGSVLFDSVAAIIGVVASLYVVWTAFSGLRIVSLYGVSTPSLRPLVGYFRFGLPLLVSGVAFWIVNFSDRWIVTYLIGLDAVGSYAIMYTLTTPIALVTNPIVNAIFPDLSELEESEESDEALRRVEQTVRYYLVFAVPAAAGLWVTADDFALLLATPQVVEVTNTVPYLTVGMLSFGLFRIHTQFLKSRDRQLQVGAVWTLIALVNLGANVVLVPNFGILGAAAATALGFGIGLVIVSLISPEVNPSPSTVVSLVTATLVMMVVGVPVDRLFVRGQLTVFVVVVVSAVTYFTVLAGMGFFTERERRVVSGTADRVRDLFSG